MLQELYTLLNFSFIMIYVISKISALLKNYVNYHKDSIFNIDFYFF